MAKTQAADQPALSHNEMLQWLNDTADSIEYFQEQNARFPINAGDADNLRAIRSRLNVAERDGFSSGVLAALAVLSDSGRAITNEYEEVVSACGPVGDLLAAAKRLAVLDTSGMALYAAQQSGVSSAR